MRRLEKEAEMTQAGQRLTAEHKEDHIEVDGFRICSWESGPPRPRGTVVTNFCNLPKLCNVRFGRGQL